MFDVRQSIDKFHIIGVNQKNSCIKTLINCVKSGTSVATAEVKRESAIIKQYAANII